MKHWLNRKLSFLFIAIFSSLYTFAQDDKKIEVDVNLNKDNGDWYQQPWVWVVGGAVFILLIVALARGRGSKKE
jgi:hypothetical protein